MFTAKKQYVIVVGVDSSEPAEAAIEQAFEIAASHERSEIHAISVTDRFESGLAAATGDGLTAAVEGTRAKLAERLEQKLDDMHRSGRIDCLARPPRIVTHLRLERPAHEIARLAAVVRADLVVVGTHGRRGLSRLLTRSVAATLVRTSPCRVLVVRSPSVEAVA